MLKIWGRINSSNVKKVVWAVGELGLPYERIEAGREFGVVNTPEYRKLNPNGLVPTIDDDGFILWESNAIIRYLAQKHGAGTLWPTNPQVRARADRWMDWQLASFTPAFTQAFQGVFRTPADKRDEAAIEAARVRADHLSAVLDAHLADHAHVAGDAFSMGDIPIGIGVHIWLNTPLPRTPRPHVERWYALLAAREAAKPTMILPLT